MVSTNFIDLLRPVLLLAVYVGISCGGLFLMKAAPVWLSVQFSFGFLLYALGACLWLVILRTYPLSIAFPAASGALMVGTMLIGAFWLGERIGVGQIAGALLIFAGIVLLVPKTGAP